MAGWNVRYFFLFFCSILYPKEWSWHNALLCLAMWKILSVIGHVVSSRMWCRATWCHAYMFPAWVPLVFHGHNMYVFNVWHHVLSLANQLRSLNSSRQKQKTHWNSLKFPSPNSNGSADSAWLHGPRKFVTVCCVAWVSFSVRKSRTKTGSFAWKFPTWLICRAEPSSDSVCLIWSVKTGANLRILERKNNDNWKQCSMQITILTCNAARAGHGLTTSHQELGKAEKQHDIWAKAMPSQQDWSLSQYMHST